MSDLIIKVCDVCDRQKGQTNHWFVMFINPELNAYLVHPLEKGVINQEHFDLIRQWKKIDLCSIECLNKAENRVREGEKLR